LDGNAVPLGLHLREEAGEVLEEWPVKRYLTTTFGSAAADAPGLDQREQGSGQYHGAWVDTGEVVEQPPRY
jgi:hypothetical protein